ncbi:ATP-binding protein, partial [Amnibacterium sp.]|uniref:sensor histidine kinase n=1 Tax=Amnibacterium sp. TaxID=1872496 RepID=UPI003F7C1225
LFVLLSLEVPLGVQNQRTERRDLTAKVSHDAMVLAADAEDAVQRPTRRQLNGLAAIASTYASRTGARVVVADRRGYALIDTSGRVRGTESFASRPEIHAALAGKYPRGVRNSRTLGERLLYVAVPIASSGRVHGAVRVTYPFSAVDSRIYRYWLILALIGIVVLAGAAVVGLGLSRFVTRPLRRLEQTAAAVGEGQLEARAPEREGPPEVRSLAAVFNETVGKLARLLRSQGEFVADASHELRTPLTALRLRLESLPASRDRDAALQETDRLRDLVDGLLTLARADAGSETPARVDATSVLRERVDAWLPLADEHHVSLVADLDGPVAVRAAPGRLAQVVDNLMANALDASPDGATVTVSALAAPPWVELHLSDQGGGLTPEQRRRAFDRFWRAGSGGGGSGLGLAIVKRLVAADGGEVELREAPSGGVDAVVRLRPA